MTNTRPVLQLPPHRPQSWPLHWTCPASARPAPRLLSTVVLSEKAPVYELKKLISRFQILPTFNQQTQLRNLQSPKKISTKTWFFHPPRHPETADFPASRPSGASSSRMADSCWIMPPTFSRTCALAFSMRDLRVFGEGSPGLVLVSQVGRVRVKLHGKFHGKSWLQVVYPFKSFHNFIETTFVSSETPGSNKFRTIVGITCAPKIYIFHVQIWNEWCQKIEPFQLFIDGCLNFVIFVIHDFLCI